MSPWTPLHAHIHTTLRSRQLVGRNDRLLIAVSGGQDSLCLLQLLRDLQPKWNWDLAIAHCDHRWRPDSAENAVHVGRLAARMDLPFYLETARSPVETEAAARSWRYRVLERIACKDGFGAIATGHTASDRAETLLFNLLRGTGADGLQALTWKRPLSPEIVLVRPLLAVTRSQTAEFCDRFALPIWQDATNHDLKYTRNRIRHELLPYLASHFNPQVERHCAQTAELLRAEVEYLEAVAAQWLQRCLPQYTEKVKSPSVKTALNREKLRDCPLALQRRVMRQWWEQWAERSPNFERIEAAIALIDAPNGTCSDPFPGGAIARVSGEWIEIHHPPT